MTVLTKSSASRTLDVKAFFIAFSRGEADYAVSAENKEQEICTYTLEVPLTSWMNQFLSLSCSVSL